MKISMSWRGNQKTRKEKRLRHKPKIRWQQLGLTDPADATSSVSMDEIRRQVVMLSSRGLGQGARSYQAPPTAPAAGTNSHKEGGRTRRRGATE